jgi:YggT family protein
MMPQLLSVFDESIAVFRIALFGVAAALAALCAVDWMVRTRKLSPFGPVARFMRTTMDPLLKPVERRVVRAGGLPSSAPWWALAAVVLAGIVLLSLLGFARSELGLVYYSVTSGPGGVTRLLISWLFGLLQLALIVRVLLSWLPVFPGAWYSRWSFALTEPMLKPLRRVVPLVAMMDITPIIAYFALGLLEGFFMRLA